MLILRTGIPGAGKTLNTIKHLVTDSKNSGRLKFYTNVKYFLLDWELCKSFQGWFFGVFWPSVQGTNHEKTYRDIIKRAHEQQRFLELSDVPHLKGQFLNHDEQQAFNLFLSWVYKLYPSSETDKIDKIKNLLGDIELEFSHVEGLNFHFSHYDDPTAWYELPNGSVYFIDECQTWFPVRDAKSRPGQHLTKFETHRHTGTDVYFVTQHPKFIDIHLRRLIGRHVHIYNPYNAKNLCLADKNKVIDVDDVFDLKSADQTQILRDSRFYGVYWSADEHTHGIRIPKQLIKLVIYIVVLVLLVFVGVGFVSSNPIFGASGDSVVNSGSPSPTSTLLPPPGASSPVPGARPPSQNVEPDIINKVVLAKSSGGFEAASYRVYSDPSKVAHPLSRCHAFEYSGVTYRRYGHDVQPIQLVNCLLGGTQTITETVRQEDDKPGSFEVAASDTLRVDVLEQMGYRLITSGVGYRLRYRDFDFVVSPL